MDGFLNQAEHEQISTSLEVERIDSNLFRSKSLWLPLQARGVFGGQVISQALVSATNCVGPAFALHSLHCYFLTSASSSTPIIYNVEHLREGKSYVTRSVKAIQNGQVVFTMLCSFQKDEPWQPKHQWKMPDVPVPEECPDEETLFEKALIDPRTPPEFVDLVRDRLSERARSPIAIKVARAHYTNPDGIVRYAYWMKARSIPKYGAPFQKCILAYASDMHFISTASKIVGLKRTGGSGASALGMISTLDHAIWFYSNDFDAGDWFLYDMDCPSVASGRGIVHGRMFTRDGRLVAVMSQEGVIRAKIKAPVENKDGQNKNTQSKL